MVEFEIRRVRDLHERYGTLMLKDRFLRSKIERYRKAISKTHTHMVYAGVTRICASCAEEHPGGCCFYGVEDWFTRELMLANLLMGRPIPDCREIPDGCLFVGHNGCKLVARYSYCINYFCPKIAKHLGPSSVSTLLSEAGDEILSGVEVEQSIRNWLTARQ